MYQALTTVVLTLHFAYLAYVVVGGFLAWRWPRMIWPHLVAAGWGLVIVANPWGWECPLTYAENWSRQRAGRAGLESGFVDQYIEGVLYPERFTWLLQLLAAVLVVGSWVGCYLRWRSRRDTAGKTEDPSQRTANV